jgi:hypothetical protein
LPAVVLPPFPGFLRRSRLIVRTRAHRANVRRRTGRARPPGSRQWRGARAKAVRASACDSARLPHDICGPIAEIPVLTAVQQGEPQCLCGTFTVRKRPIRPRTNALLRRASRISTRKSASPGSMSALPFTSCRRTRSLSAESQRTISSGSGLIKLHAILCPNGDDGGWTASTICSIPSYTTEVIAGRSISTKRQSTSGLFRE